MSFQVIPAVEASQMTAGEVLADFRNDGAFHVTFPEGHLVIEKTSEIYRIGGDRTEVNVIAVAFLERDVFDGGLYSSPFQKQYFPRSQEEEAVECFMRRLKSEWPFRVSGGSETLGSIAAMMARGEPPEHCRGLDGSCIA